MENTGTFNLITRDNSDSIITCLDSTLPANIKNYVICDTGSSDNTIALVLEWGLKNDREIKVVFYEKKYGYKWGSEDFSRYDFGKARQMALEETKTPAMIWLDSDDILEGAEGIPTLIQQLLSSDFHQVLTPYRYGVDQYENDIVVLWRERIVKLTPGLQWREPVHEYLDYGEPVQSVTSDLVRWRHTRKPEHIRRTGRRNREILRHQYNTIIKQKLKPHLRLLQNLAYDHFEHREFSESATFYSEFFARYSELPDSNRDKQMDIMQLQYNMSNWAKTEEEQENFDKALELYQRALSYDEVSKYLYVAIAELKLKQLKLQEADFYLSIASGLSHKPSLLPINAVDIRTRELLIKSEIEKRGARFENAIALLQDALKVTPGNEILAKEIGILNTHLARKGSFDAYYAIKNELLNEGNWDKLASLVSLIPNSILEQTAIEEDRKKLLANVKVYKQRSKVKLKGNLKIAIYAGPAYEAWAGDSRKSGIGGSEEMVIGVADHLQKIGHEVFVYNDCKELEGEYNGVKYIDYKQYKDTMKFDVLIISRLPTMMIQQTDKGLDYRVHASTRQILWLHDTYYGDLPAFAFSLFDKIFVLSEFHKENIKHAYGVPDEKFHVTRNGIEVEHYLELPKQERDLKQLIYCSSYDRGLYEVLLGFKKIKAEVPDAKLKIFYGWDTYTKRMESMPPTFSSHPSGISMKDYKKRVIELIQELGVTDGGRIGQDELYLELSRSNIWYYDTWFSEISCISAMRAQLAGAIPVHSGVAALKETVKAGIEADGDKAVEVIIDLLKNPAKAEEIRSQAIEAGKQFSLSSLIAEWDNFLKTI